MHCRMQPGRHPYVSGRESEVAEENPALRFTAGLCRVYCTDCIAVIVVSDGMEDSVVDDNQPVPKE